MSVHSSTSTYYAVASLINCWRYIYIANSYPVLNGRLLKNVEAYPILYNYITIPHEIELKTGTYRLIHQNMNWLYGRAFAYAKNMWRLKKER